MLSDVRHFKYTAMDKMVITIKTGILIIPQLYPIINYKTRPGGVWGQMFISQYTEVSSH